MLVITCTYDEAIVIDDRVVVRILDVIGERAVLGIQAPADVSIVRAEVEERRAQRRVAAVHDGASPVGSAGLCRDDQRSSRLNPPLGRLSRPAVRRRAHRPLPRQQHRRQFLPRPHQQRRLEANHSPGCLGSERVTDRRMLSLLAAPT